MCIRMNEERGGVGRKLKKIPGKRNYEFRGEEKGCRLMRRDEDVEGGVEWK